MEIKIDVREHDLIPKIQALLTATDPSPHTLVPLALPIGDIVISRMNSPEELIIVERKTVKDLMASITDGRYDEQSYRLSGSSHPNHNIIYLIEGALPKGNMMVFSALFSLNYYKGFSVMRSMSLDETAFMIVNMAGKIHREWGKKIPFFAPVIGENTGTSGGGEDGVPNASAVPYSSMVKKVKHANITPENIHEIMLCQIPNVSSANAAPILAIYPTISALTTALTADPTCLNQLQMTDTNGKKRKIGSHVIASILHHLITPS